MNTISASRLQVELLAQPYDVHEISSIEREALTVSGISVDGTWQVISRYGDDIWRLNGRTTNKSENTTIIKFSKIPKAFRETTKVMLWRYLRKGRIGRSRVSAGTIRKTLEACGTFFSYLITLNIQRISDITTSDCISYVNIRKAQLSASGKPLSSNRLKALFEAIEFIFEMSQMTTDPMSQHPWPDSSSSILAGCTGKGHSRNQGSKTPLIPDDIFCAVIQAAFKLVAEGDYLLSLRDSIATIDLEMADKDVTTTWERKSRFLLSKAWIGGLTSLNEMLIDLRTACYIVIAGLSGCRNHEIAFLQTNSYFRTEIDGESYWWIKSKSTKTEEGPTEWMIPEAAVDALRIMDRWAEPYNAIIANEIDQRRTINPADVEIAKAEMHLGAAFLGLDTKYNNRVRTLSVASFNDRLRIFARKNGIRWRFATHQFRRKFAEYAARSKFGDLRYLKQHFKHWTIDMTLLYAVNDSQELALFAEITDELDALREGKIAEWLDSKTPLSGGAGRSFVEFRGTNPVAMFTSHAVMIKTLSENVAIRSNGHAWCTADSGIECVGNGGLDRTRCTECSQAVIGSCHARTYQGLYDHLATLLHCEDIGEAGLARVRRDLARCGQTLRDLGFDPEVRSAA